MPAPSTPAPAPAAEPPRSAAHFGLNLLGLAGGLGIILALLQWGPALDARIGPLPAEMGTIAGNHLLIALAGCAVVFLIIGGGELFWHRSYRNAGTGMAPQALRPADAARVAVRLLGFAFTLGIAAFVYWLFPEYHGAFYNPWWAFLQTLAWPVALLAIPYFVWTDRRLQEPRDAYWHLGCLPYAALANRMELIDGKALRAHFMAWTVKGFFLALMVVYLNGNIGELGTALGGLLNEPLPWYQRNWYPLFYSIGYVVDLLFCVVGYTITLRLFDSHIRSTEPTAFGWVIALMCYMPFYRTIGDMYLNYQGSFYWDNWLAGVPWLKNVWGGAIVLLVFVYGLATVSFGLRFSNLTYRGVITNGPYRYTKHPAYLSKNLSWWLISVPWVWQDDFFTALRHCCLLALLNLVYYLRARTEENHLSLRDPDYVAYALWMEEHGIMSWAGRIFPIFRYKPPAGAATAPQVPAAVPPAPAKPLKAARAGKR
jgi:hypothetical protein